ncbi:putative glutathione transferase [Helianthus annuus]|nr:putative glutathione transferase [Helianthus annuus]
MSKKEHKAPEFLSRNPSSQVPALEDGDLKLFGTNYNCLWKDFSLVFGFLKILRVHISRF